MKISSVELFFYNTDRNALAQSRVNVLLSRGLAVTGGRHGRYLGKPKPGDWLIMFENAVGLLAVGEVLEFWNKKSYSSPIYYHRSTKEYRLKVDWFERFENKPISLNTLRTYLGNKFNPRGAIQRIVKHREAVHACIQQHLKKPLPNLGSDFAGSSIPVRN